MEGVGRQGLVKRRIEDRHLRDAHKPDSGGLDTEEIGRVVKWGQRDESFDGINHLVVDHGRLPEELSPMDHTMTDAEEFRIVLDDPVLTVHIGHEVEPVPVIRQPFRIDQLVERPVGVSLALTQATLTAPDVLDQSRRKHEAVGQAENLVLDGRTPAVDDSHFHGVIPSV